MKRSNEDGALPRAALLGAGFLVIGSLCLVSVARLTGYKPERPDGSVAVYNSAENRMVDFLPPGTNGFVRGVLRGLVRGRKAESIDATPPFRLTRWADGRLSLDDPSTGRHVDLEVFGPTNAAAFADILVASGRPKDQS